MQLLDGGLDAILCSQGWMMTQHTCPQCGGKLIQVVIPSVAPDAGWWDDEIEYECRPCQRGYDWFELEYAPDAGDGLIAMVGDE